MLAERGGPALFPAFRAHFCSASTWKAEGPKMNPDGIDAPYATSPTPPHRPNLRALDLRALSVEESAPSETQLRRQKYLYFEKHCSEVSPGLFLSGDYVAKSRETLRQAGVTHVLNCVGFICKEYFKEELTYKTLFLQDTPAEDISCILYDCLDYIDSALLSGGRILVHCSQGVSRSATLVMAYMMWRSGKPYDEVFATVKSIRGVANPNIGFTCQLLQWQKRAAAAKARMRMYRIASHCVHAPHYLVPKLITPPKQYPNNTHRDLDPRGAFVLQTAGGPTYVWRGEHCPDAYVVAAHRAAHQLVKFECAGQVVEVRQGHEPAALVALLDPAPLDAEAARLNARRSSITGEIELPTNSRDHTSGPQPHQAAASTAEGADMDMDADSPYPSTPHPGPAAGGLPMELGTPMGGSAPSLPGLFGSPSGGLPSLLLVGSRQQAAGSWTPEEVEEYTDDYMLFWHSQQQGKAGTSGTFEGNLRVSYDTAAGGLSTGAAPRGPGGEAAALVLLAAAGARPDSPATKEGRHKKYRRADSERPKLGYWTAACSDGVGPELARTHNVSSLHESVDEEILGMSPRLSGGPERDL